MVIDACESSQFSVADDGSQRQAANSHPPARRPVNRLTFLSQGTISFSSFFWEHVLNGLDIRDAFVSTSASLGQSVAQTPELDATNDRVVNEAADLNAVRGIFIGNGTDASKVPHPRSVPSARRGRSRALTAAPLWANVTDADGVARVWAVLHPPGYVPSSPSNPVQSLPSIDLLPTTGDHREATYDKFSVARNIYHRDLRPGP